jgi:hypothetical protein
MKHALFSAAAITAVLASGPASADSITCAEINMSVVTTMIGTMADGPPKWEMNRQLATINQAMASDDKHRCNVAMMNITRGSSAPAKSGT